jgi:hypothetical protein
MHARAENRYANEEELLDTFGTLDLTLKECKQELETASEQSTDTVRGVAGEAIVLYLSVFSALSEGGECLYPSSYREDNPHIDTLPLHLKQQTHDAHTYAPDNPGERVIVSVKARKSTRSSGGELATRINILNLAADVYRKSSGIGDTEQVKLDLLDIITLLQAADDTDSPDSATGINFRKQLSDMVQAKIISSRPVDLSAITYPES